MYSKRSTKPTKTGLKQEIQGLIRKTDEKSGKKLYNTLYKLWKAYPNSLKKEKLRGTAEENVEFVVNVKGDGIELELDNEEYQPISYSKMIDFYLYPERISIILKQHACEALKKAARHEIRDQTRAFRSKKALKDPKYIDGEKWHVGHDYEKGDRFEEIFEKFCKTQLRKGTKIEVYSMPCSHNKQFKSKSIAKKWSEYHKKHAILRMERATGNLEGNRGFGKKEPWIQDFIPF